MHAWRRREDFVPGERASYKTWLYAIAKNAIGNHWRSAHRRRVVPFLEDDDGAYYLPFPDTEPLPDEALDQKVKIDLIEQALDHLPEAYSSVLRLRYFAGCSHREISIRLNMPEDQAPAYLYKAQWAVRALVGESGVV